MVTIQLNGEQREIAAGWTVETLIHELSRDRRTVAVEFNGHILPQEEYAKTLLRPADRLEIVRFVQGG